MGYSPEQISNATIIWEFWESIPGYGAIGAAAWVGNTDAENSLNPKLFGDKDTAGGDEQWHQLRRGLLLKHTGIDVWEAGVWDQCRAAYAEITESWSAYRHVDARLRACVTLQGRIAVLVSQVEQSGDQTRDIVRRTKLAEYWLGQLGGDKA